MLDEFVGGSPAIKKLHSILPKLSQSPDPVILVREGGVGKTLFASHIHARSSRNVRPIESLNFSLIPERDQRIALLRGDIPDVNSPRRSILEHPTTVIL